MKVNYKVGGHACAKILGDNLGKGKHRLEISQYKDDDMRTGDRDFMVCGLLVSEVS